jgi:hypothetical protein
MEVNLAAGESFDDHHDAGAGGTTRAWRLGWIDAGRHAEKRAAVFERSTPSAVGEESEVSDAHQATRQHVKQEAAQELMSGNGHDLLLAAASIVSPSK